MFKLQFIHNKENKMSIQEPKIRFFGGILNKQTKSLITRDILIKLTMLIVYRYRAIDFFCRRCYSRWSSQQILYKLKHY